MPCIICVNETTIFVTVLRVRIRIGSLPGINIPLVLNTHLIQLSFEFITMFGEEVGHRLLYFVNSWVIQIQPAN